MSAKRRPNFKPIRSELIGCDLVCETLAQSFESVPQQCEQRSIKALNHSTTFFCLSAFYYLTKGSPGDDESNKS